MDKYEELKTAVREHLDQMYREDEEGDSISWPSSLERLVGWESPASE